MQKILLDTDDEKLNQRQVLRAINNSGISRKDMTFNFIESNGKRWCLFTTCDDERNLLPKKLKDTLISFKALEAKTLS